MSVIAIILLSGIVGGTINYFLSKPDKMDVFTWMRTAFIGVGAAFLMPLFLNTISSSLLSDMFKENSTHDNYFVFSGFCLLAAISSRAFIQTLSDKVLKEAKEARREVAEVRSEVGEIESSFYPIVDSMTEQDTEKSDQQEFLSSKVTDLELKILQALISHPKFTLRSLTGITQEMNKVKDVGREDVRSGLANLAELGLVHEIIGKMGIGSRWAIARNGKTIVENAQPVGED
jgi:hypothetical protein